MLNRTVSAFVVLSLCAGHTAFGAEYLVKFKKDSSRSINLFLDVNGGDLAQVSDEGRLYKWTTDLDVNKVMDQANVEFIQPNYKISLFANPSIVQNRAAILQNLEKLAAHADGEAFPDNPEYAALGTEAAGADPLLAQAWGIKNSGADLAWQKLAQGAEIVVAVTDTGVDYNHKDLIHNMWRNKGEIAGDNIDNDNNGYVDDVVGYDFFSKDAKPYDLSMDLFDILLSGGNPGHGTHVAGVVAARMNNSQGTAGVAPKAKIMALRFIGEKGQGDTAGAVGAIDYAVKNGANVINASWGSQGEEAGDNALREAIQRAEKAGVLFVAAAGNGRNGAGYNNDTDPKPSFPATYPYANIVSVAAMDVDNNLGAFSNFGKATVHIGAPGVKIMSTVPGSKYQDTIIDFGQFKVTWDGTSMASPFVAGSAAVLWSQERNATASQIKERLLAAAAPTSTLSGKVATEGRLDLRRFIAE